MNDFIVLHRRKRNGDEGERVAINFSHVDFIKSCMDERGFYTDVHLISGLGFIVHEEFSKVMKLITSSLSKYLCADCVSKEQCNGEWTTHCASYVPKEHKQTNTDLAWNKGDLLAMGIWAKYEEPKYKFEKSFEKFIKKWLRTQKKNRRRWG